MKIRIEKKFIILLILLLSIVGTNLIVKEINLAKLPPDTITFWLDGYYHLGLSEIILNTQRIPIRDPFWISEGVPHVYADGYAIILTTLQLLSGIDGPTASNLMMLIFSTLTLITVFLISQKIFNNEKIAFLISIMLIFVTGFWEYTSLPIPQTVAIFLMNLIFYFIIKNDILDKKNILILGLMAGGLCLIHPMSFEVFFLITLFFSILTLIFERKKGIKKFLPNLAILALSFLFSILWWLRLYKAGLNELSVREMDEFQMLKHYLWYLSIMVYLAPLGFLIGILKKNKYVLLLLCWILVSWILIENHRLDYMIYQHYIPEKLEFIKEFLKPNWGQRFFIYISIPVTILTGFILNGMYNLNIKIKKINIGRTICLPFVIFGITLTLLTDTFITPPWFARLVYDTWVSESELEAIQKLENANIMPSDSMINADFPFDEVYFGITGKTSTISPQLRSSIPLNQYLNDYIGIYFSNNFDEIKSLADKYGITHIVLSNRIIEKGHFATTSSKWNYQLYSGLKNANLNKFSDKTKFKKIFSYKDVKVFCIQPCKR